MYRTKLPLTHTDDARAEQRKRRQAAVAEAAAGLWLWPAGSKEDKHQERFWRVRHAVLRKVHGDDAIGTPLQ